MNMYITVKLLLSKNACYSQVCLFRKHFPEGTEVTKELCLKYAEIFSFRWAARNLLSFEQQNTYDEAEDLAYKTYDEALALTYKTYDEALALTSKTYDEAEDLAYKTYCENAALVKKTYNEAVALAFYDAQVQQ